MRTDMRSMHSARNAARFNENRSESTRGLCKALQGGRWAHLSWAHETGGPLRGTMTFVSAVRAHSCPSQLTGVQRGPECIDNGRRVPRHRHAQLHLHQPRPGLLRCPDQRVPNLACTARTCEEEVSPASPPSAKAAPAAPLAPATAGAANGVTRSAAQRASAWPAWSQSTFRETHRQRLPMPPAPSHLGLLGMQNRTFDPYLPPASSPQITARHSKARHSARTSHRGVGPAGHQQPVPRAQRQRAHDRVDRGGGVGQHDQVACITAHKACQLLPYPLQSCKTRQDPSVPPDNAASPPAAELIGTHFTSAVLACHC
jgi:hypothetical protein